MHSLSRDESPRSSAIPDIHLNSKEIQKKKKKVKQIQKQTTQITISEE